MTQIRFHNNTTSLLPVQRDSEHKTMRPVQREGSIVSSCSSRRTLLLRERQVRTKVRGIRVIHSAHCLPQSQLAPKSAQEPRSTLAELGVRFEPSSIKRLLFIISHFVCAFPSL